MFRQLFNVKTVKDECIAYFSTPFSSMFFDEDGDLAHEFYVEVPPSRKGCKATMKKVLHNLIPQASTMQETQRQSFYMECQMSYITMPRMKCRPTLIQCNILWQFTTPSLDVIKKSAQYVDVKQCVCIVGLSVHLPSHYFLRNNLCS